MQAAQGDLGYVLMIFRAMMRCIVIHGPNHVDVDQFRLGWETLIAACLFLFLLSVSDMTRMFRLSANQIEAFECP